MFEQLEKAYEEHQAGLRSDTRLKIFLKSHIGYMTKKVSWLVAISVAYGISGMLRVGSSLNRDVFSKRVRLVGSPSQLLPTLTTCSGSQVSYRFGCSHPLRLTKNHKSCRKIPKSSRDNQTGRLYVLYEHPIMSVLLIIVGIGSILFSAIKSRQFASHVPPELLEETAGTGIVPSWVSVMHILGWLAIIVGLISWLGPLPYLD